MIRIRTNWSERGDAKTVSRKKTESKNKKNNNTGEAARQRKLQPDCPLVYSEKNRLYKYVPKQNKNRKTFFYIC